MSRRSGCLSAVAHSAKVDAAEADNHSDISPRKASRLNKGSREGASSLTVASWNPDPGLVARGEGLRGAPRGQS
jgi:hypothetical protein